jgi:tRNA nucleotidyltransferase (CCA-adding enzyme)
VLTHQRFGTAKWTIDLASNRLAEKLSLDTEQDATSLPESLDLITARTEFYEQPAALPTVESSSIKMDLHRRDFTINTLALRLDGEHYGMIYDYWGGLSDLHKGHIRVLHALSFVDDATRLLRAVRFEQRFDFQIEPRTRALMDESLPLLKKLTGARIRHEINLILAEPNAPAMLARLAELEILKAIHPALPWDNTLRDNLASLNVEEIEPLWGLPAPVDSLHLKQTLSTLVWLGHLPESTLKAIASRLRLKGHLKHLLLATSKLNHALPELENALPSDIVHEVEKAPRMAVYAAYWVNQEEKLRSLLRSYVSKWASIEPKTTGDDLREMGLPPSPTYGRILQTLRDARIDGEIQSDQDEKAMLEKLVSEVS